MNAVQKLLHIATLDGEDVSCFFVEFVFVHLLLCFGRGGVVAQGRWTSCRAAAIPRHGRTGLIRTLAQPRLGTQYAQTDTESGTKRTRVEHDCLHSFHRGKLLKSNGRLKLAGTS
eukprot:1594341-Amphidinium_carterae.1